MKKNKWEDEDYELEMSSRERAEARNTDPADLGPMYTDGPEWRGPDVGPPIYDEYSHWVSYQKKGRFKRWLKKVTRM